MELKKMLMADLKQAMIDKDVVRKETITCLRAAILQVEKDEQKELLESEIFAIVAKEIKKRRDSLPDYEKAERQDIISRINEEMILLEKYLPEQLSEEKIREIVLNVIKTTNATSLREMGKVMTEIKPQTQGKADGKVVSDIVKEELAKLQ